MTEPPSIGMHRDRVLATVSPLPAVTVPTSAALGRVLVTDVTATLSVPPFDHAAMDGYAVRSVDVEGASDHAPARLPVVGVVAAGDAWTDELAPGAALRIMTGAPVPAGADAVVPFEWTDRASDQVAVYRSSDRRNIRRAGEDVAAGSVALHAGVRLGAQHLGLLSSVGCAEVDVRPVPRVAVVATGAELVASYGVTDLGAAAVPDSNSVTLAASVRLAGGEPQVHGPAPDDPAEFAALLVEAAAGADLVVTSGGISAGDHDVVKAALRERDGMWFGSVAVKPGRPQGAGTVDVDGRAVPLVCLPGTPVAAFSSFLLFGVPAIRVMAGRASRPRVGSTDILAETVAADAERTVVLPGGYDECGRVVVLRGHAGHSQRLMADADVLLVIPPGEPVAAGERVDVVRLSPEDS